MQTNSQPINAYKINIKPSNLDQPWFVHSKKEEVKIKGNLKSSATNSCKLRNFLVDGKI
jgi:hypothetical protein